MLSEQDEKILKLYKNDIRKKKIIIFLLSLIFIGGISLYYFYININQLPKEKSDNNVEKQIKYNIIEENTKDQSINNTTKEEEKTKSEDNKSSLENVNNEVIIENTQEESKIITDEKKKENNIEKENIKKDTTEKTNNNKAEKPKNKDFLFSDGYTMDNVSQAAQSYLKSYNWSGECIPIKDKEGVYLGMRVIFY